MLVTALGVLAALYLVICTLLYLLQERLLFFPEVLAPNYSFTFLEPFEEVSLPVDGATVHALHFTRRDAKGVVLYLHGNAGSLRAWGSVADDFLVHDYAVFMPDYRGYGKSTGTISSERVLHQDMAAAYDYLLQHYPEQQIVVYGRSIGTGPAVYLARSRHPKLLILETPYYNLQELAAGQFPWVPPFLFKYPLRVDRWISEVSSPIYLVHGTRDDVIPYSASARLLPLIRAEHQLLTVEGGGHNNLTAFPQYHDFLAALLR